ncbi:MAG: hypothetical protein Q4D96_10325 [Propionibacteriaceae bacterium]|nr:hypothetical protein [Propionibacteriaceae bacterium]
MDPNANHLIHQLRDRGFFKRHVGRRRRSHTTVVVSSVLLLLSASGAAALYLRLRDLPNDPGVKGAQYFDNGMLLLFGMLILGIVAVVCLFVLVGPVIARQFWRRRDYVAFQEGGELCRQADLGIVIDAVDNQSKQAAMLGLILPLDAPREAAQQAAAVVGQRIAAGRGTAFMAIESTLVQTGRGWPERGIGVDDLGNRFAPMGPGGYVAVLPDGAALGIDPGAGQPLDVSRIVQGHAVQQQFRYTGDEMVFRQSLLVKMVAMVCIVFMAGVGYSLWSSFSSSSSLFFRGIAWAIPGLLIPMLVYTLNQLFAKTLVVTEGIHMMSLLRRWSLPWNQIRGFGVMRHGTSGRTGASGHDSIGGSRHNREDGYLYQVVVVDRTGRARGLPGLEYRSHFRQARPEKIVQRLCELDAYRRARQ